MKPLRQNNKNGGRSSRPKKRQRSPSSSSSFSSSSHRSSSNSTIDQEETRRKLKGLKTLERRMYDMVHRASFSCHSGEEKVIPIFDPQRSEQSIESWVLQVDELVQCYRWDDLTIIKLVASRLTGMARRWYDSQEQLNNNWSEMKQLMLRQFYKPLPFSKLLREAALYETRKGQDLSEYCFNKLERLRALKLDIPEAYLVDAIIGGITDKNIARTTRSSRFTDTNELYAYLSTIGHLPGSRPVKSAPTPQYATPGTSTEKSLKMGIECYNCKGPHRARDCPKSRVECFNCKQRGHFQSKCPFKRRPNNGRSWSERGGARGQRNSKPIYYERCLRRQEI
jgi:hypothetical protein